MKIRLIESPLAIPRYRQIRLPTVAAEFTPYADVEINDENIEAIDFSHADLVGFTAQAYNASRAIYLSGKFRSLGMKTIVGGPWPTAVGAKALEYFDAAVAGEVEGLGERIVRDFKKGSLGGLYRLDKPPANWGERPARRDLQKADRYYWLNFPIEFTRGCPHQCSFCFGRYLHPGFRTRRLDTIAAEIAQWDHGLIEAVDLHFGADRNFIIEVCRLMADMGVAGWFGQATLGCLDDDELLKHMERSNCVQVFIGIESIEADVLNCANKGFNKVADYRRIIRKAQDHGILIHAGLMWGLDGQTPASFDRTAEFCEETGIYLVSLNIATFFPGTSGHESLKNEGRILTDDARNYDSCRMAFQPRGITAEEVYRGTRRFVHRFYSLRSIFMRSFQPANNRLARLVDFWGFNLIYRAYAFKWARFLGREKIPWKGSGEEKESFPYVGWRMPMIYDITNLEWIFFHYCYKAWDMPPAPVSKAATIGILLLTVAAGLAAHVWIGQVSFANWPVFWPPAWAGFLGFMGATFIFTWLTSRIARLSAGKADDQGSRAPEEPSSFFNIHSRRPVTGRDQPGQDTSAVRAEAKDKEATRSLPVALYVLLILSAAFPMAVGIMSMPAHATAWRFAAGFMAAVLLMKSWSVVTSNRWAWKNPFRVGAFLLFFPTLDFDTAFVVNPEKKNLVRHYLLMGVGLLRMAAAVPLVAVIILAAVKGFNSGIYEPLGAVGRLIVLYLFLRGLLEYLTASWRMAGYVIEPPFGRHPFGPELPSRIWNSWNTPFGNWLRQRVYFPLGGRQRPVAAVAGTFAVSGLILAGMLSPVTGGFPFPVFLFIMANGSVIVLEKWLLKRYEPGQVLTCILYFAAAVVFLLTAGWLFSITDRIFI